MSFTPRFAPDAESQWHELDFELQELVLDEMERLAANPPRTIRGFARHDFMLDRPGERHYVFLRLAIDRVRQIMRVIGLYHHISKR